MTDSDTTPVPAAAADPEQLLYSFGPFGVSICKGTYGVFKWQKENVTRVELAGHCVRGVRQRSRGLFGLLTGPAPDRGLLFEIPYAAIVGVALEPHPAGLGLQKVITITYREDDAVPAARPDAAAAAPASSPPPLDAARRRLSIAAYTDPAERAFALLQGLTQD